MKNFLLAKISPDLSKDDNAALKGAAILMIVLHNFCHWILPVTENEYSFELNKSMMWLENFCNGGPHVILNFLSFWGHYGVAVFLFLSGFGLVRKYESPTSGTLEFLPFMKHNYLKLWKLLFIAVIIQCFIDFDIWNFVLLTFASNLIPEAELVNGPWWFFSLIIQCYCLYALCFYRKNNIRPVIAALISLSILVIALILDAPEDIFRYIRLNIFGWVLPFASGVIFARKRFEIPVWGCLVALVLFFLSEFNAFAWTIAPALVCIGFIPLMKMVKGKIRAFLSFTGVISAAMFVIHPLTRNPIIYYIYDEYDFPGKEYLCIFVYIALTYLFAYGYHRILKKNKQTFFIYNHNRR